MFNDREKEFYPVSLKTRSVPHHSNLFGFSVWIGRIQIVSLDSECRGCQFIQIYLVAMF